MKRVRFWQLLTLLSSALWAIALFRCFQQEESRPVPSREIAQNTYLGPTKKVTGNPQLIFVEVLVHDNPKLEGLQIQSVTFNHQSIPLKPRDIHGFRGSASFQLPPGQYKLYWVVKRDRLLWPRTIEHEEIVTLSPKDLWVQISITGDEISLD